MRRAYGIRDTATNELTPQLFIAHHDAHAIRAFQEMASDDRHPVNRYLSDHELVDLGEVADIAEAIYNEDANGRNQKWRVVITGKALIDMTTPREPQLVKEA